jgi:hypothetical protein
LGQTAEEEAHKWSRWGKFAETLNNSIDFIFLLGLVCACGGGYTLWSYLQLHTSILKNFSGSGEFASLLKSEYTNGGLAMALHLGENEVNLKFLISVAQIQSWDEKGKFSTDTSSF